MPGDTTPKKTKKSRRRRRRTPASRSTVPEPKGSVSPPGQETLEGGADDRGLDLSAIDPTEGSLTPQQREACVHEISALLTEASNEWEELQQAIKELREELTPEDFSEAVACAGLQAVEALVALEPQPQATPDPAADSGESEPPETSTLRRRIAAGFQNSRRLATRIGLRESLRQKREKNTEENTEKVQIARELGAQKMAAKKELARSASEKKLAEKRAAQKKAAEKKAAERKAAERKAAAKKSPAAPKKPAAEKKAITRAPAVAPPALQRNDSSIDHKLEEVIKLLKHNLNSDSRADSQGVDIPSGLTQEIAREVAGRLQDTVLSNLQSGSPTGSGKAPGSPGSPPEKEAAKKIPLGDVQAIIDQLTNPD